MKTAPAIAAEAGELRPALAALAKVVDARAPDPALQHVKVEGVGRAKARLTGTGGGTTFSVDIGADIPPDATPFLVSPGRFRDIIRGAKSQEMIALRPERGAPSASGFPQASRLRAATAELGEDAVAAVLRAFACSSTDETRHVLRSALVEPCDNGRFRTVGTDGRHLFASQPFELPGVKEAFVLPALKIFGSPAVRRSPSWTLGIGRPDNGSGTPFQIGGDGWCITGHLIEGNYPNYRQVVPPDRDFKTRLALPPESLPDIIHALGRMPGSRAQNSPVGIRAGNGTVGILAREDGVSPYEEVTIPARAEGAPATVFVNRDYLAKALSFGLTEIAITDAISPVKITGEGGLMIVMPIRVQGEIEVCRKEALGGRTPRREPTTTPRKPAPIPAPAQPKPQPKGEHVPQPAPQIPAHSANGEHDPVDAAVRQIAAVKDALRAAMAAVNDIAATLKETRLKQRQSEKEFRSVRDTLRSLRKVEL